MVTLPAEQFNRPGQHHNDVYHYVDGTPTGQELDTAMLLFPGHEGRVQLDYKEIQEAFWRRYLFARGGSVLHHDPVPYRHVWIADIEDHLGSSVPSGDGRGAPAPLLNRRVTLDVKPIPDEMGYKPLGTNPGS